ncbi:MAG: DedA family protein [Candidatus Falkowbacteria bacterium]
MHELIALLLALSAKMGYGGIVLLMAVESSFIPFPSEIVVPPAAYLASQGEMNIFLVIISGIAGSLIGATFNYFLSMWLGRRVVYSLSNTRIAKVLLISESQIIKSEDLFLRFGNLSTFWGRLIPAVRQLISLPAGFSRMPYKNFIFFTFLGSGLWTVILAVLGYAFGANQEELRQYYKEISVIFGAIAIGVIIFMVIKKKRSKAQTRTS